MTAWFWVSLPAYTFALRAKDGVVNKVPPIAKWAQGKALAGVLAYFRKRGADVWRLSDYPASVSSSGGGAVA